MKKIFFFLILTLMLNNKNMQAAPILSLNSHGKDVVTLQQTLLNIDPKFNFKRGIFDEETKKALMVFQEKNQLPITGNTDRETWHKLLEVKNKPNNILSPKKDVKNKNANIKPQKNLKKIAPPKINKNLKKDKNNIKISLEKKKIVIKSNPDNKYRHQNKEIIDEKKALEIIKTAKKYMGTPYSFGGNTPKGFDCSGYLEYVFSQHNIEIPRTADEQYYLGKKISVDKLTPGDLVFFQTYDEGISHCGIYLGKGEFIHASTSKGVRIDRLDSEYWQEHFYGAKKIVR